jgi:NAD-dependent dihydropyrimidine dehydrogenase PreA subunit
MSKLVLCACKKGNKVSKQKLSDWQEELDKQNVAYTLIEDLCGLAAKGKIELSNVSDGDETVFIGCQPKAMINLLKNAGIQVDENNFDFKNAKEIPSHFIKENDFSKGQSKQITYDKDWKPWYPVLDYSLCTSCQKCMNFCLFGVYTLSDEGKVIVENPENCKDLCPACARTCPQGAIVFPKHHDSPIDGGEGEFKDDAGSLLTQIQKSNDVYQLLANRRKASGVSLFKADQLKIAEQERDKCKNKDV